MTAFVTIVLLLLLVALIKEALRPGIVLFSGAVVFLCAGVLTPKEVLEGFSNKGMITVALLFLVSEGVRRSGLLEQMLGWLLPKGQLAVRRVQLRMMPAVSFISAFLNNTPVVVIFAPMIKRWAEQHKVSPTKLLIPLSYATILGGMCTLIGTSTNLVVHGMALDYAAQCPDSGVRGLDMFELGKVGLIIAVVGTLYILIASNFLLPERREERHDSLAEGAADSKYFRVEVVLGARFPAINRRVRDFDFKEKYGATLLEIRRNGQTLLMHDMRKVHFHDGDTLVLLADEAFMNNWGDSSFFLMVADTRQKEAPMSRKKQWFTVVLLALMIFGAAIGELPVGARARAGHEVRHVLLRLRDHRHYGLGQYLPCAQIHQVYLLGHPRDHCLRLCHQQSHAKFRYGRCRSQLGRWSEPRARRLRPAGRGLHHHQHLHRTDDQQRRCGPIVSHLSLHCRASGR